MFRKAPSTRPCLASGRLLIAPLWLMARGDNPEIGWIMATPPPAPYAHLVSMWRCFGEDFCYSRSNRLWWLRATGMWDRRLDVAGLTPGGSLWDSDTRVLTLSGKTITEMKSFLDLHRALHDLVVAASLTGRRPVMPTLPCDFLQSKRDDIYLHRVPWPDVVAVGPPHKARCHLFPGGAECRHTDVMHGFDFTHFRKEVAAMEAQGKHTSAHEKRWPRIRLRTLEAYQPGADRAMAVCNHYAQDSLHNARIAVLEDAGASDHLLMEDVNLTAVLEGGEDDFDSIHLLPASKSALVKTCPFFDRWVGLKRACPGYLLSNDEALERALRRSPSLSRAPLQALPAKDLWNVSKGADGFCEETIALSGDCSQDAQGQTQLRSDQVTSWSLASSVCMRRCLRCANCQFVSISLVHKDCSWFKKCKMDRLRKDVPSFQSFQAPGRPDIRAGNGSGKRRMRV